MEKKEEVWKEKVIFKPDPDIGAWVKQKRPFEKRPSNKKEDALTKWRALARRFLEAIGVVWTPEQEQRYRELNRRYKRFLINEDPNIDGFSDRRHREDPDLFEDARTPRYIVPRTERDRVIAYNRPNLFGETPEVPFSVAEFDEMKQLETERQKYMNEYEKIGGVRGSDFDLRGGGVIDWMKKKYQSFTQPQTQPQTQPVVLQANQPLPPEIPSTNIVQQVASNAYKTQPSPVSGFNLLEKTPTVIFYQSATNPKLYLYGIRGTVVSDKNDRNADLSVNEGIVGNNLKKSKRFKTDKASIEDFASRRNLDGSEFIVGCGHSLSGALNDELLQEGLIDYAVSFNPAVQPKDVNFTQFHRRIYLDKDPLYQTMARNNVKNNIEVRQTEKTVGSNILGAINTNLGNLWQTKEAHSIDNFVGGKKGERLYDEDKNVWVGGGMCMCPMSYDPVVGKDGKIYNNRCQASCAERKFDEAENRWVGGAQYFSFRNPTNELMFAQELSPERCNFKLKNGNLCKRKQCIGTEYCFQHLPSHMKLKIKQSDNIRGKGLYAEKDFKKDEIVAKYNGVRIDENELQRRYGTFTAPYAVQNKHRQNKQYIDSATLRGVASMTNAPIRNEHANTQLKTVNSIQKNRTIDEWNNKNPRDTISRNNYDIVIVATKAIKMKEQILVDYGNHYQFDGNHKTTTKKPPETFGQDIKKGYYRSEESNENHIMRVPITEDDVLPERAERAFDMKCFYKIPMNLWVAPFCYGLINYLQNEDFALMKVGYWGGYEHKNQWDVSDNLLPITNTIDLYMTIEQSKLTTDAFLQSKSQMFHPNNQGELMSWDTVSDIIKNGIGNKKKAILFCVNIQPFDPKNVKNQNHSGLLIYDKDEKTLSFYDPYGSEMGDDEELNKVFKKQFYNKKQREKYHAIFKKIARNLNCGFVSSREVHNGKKGFQTLELTNNDIKNSCMWWGFYMYSTLVQAYADKDKVQSVKSIIQEYTKKYNTAQQIEFFKDAIIQIANIINKEVENQNIPGISKPFIPFSKSNETRDKKLIMDSKEVALHYDPD